MLKMWIYVRKDGDPSTMALEIPEDKEDWALDKYMHASYNNWHIGLMASRDLHTAGSCYLEFAPFMLKKSWEDIQEEMKRRDKEEEEALGCLN